MMATTPPTSRLLHPLDIIAYFVANGGRSTNNELVRNFKEFLTLSEVCDFNKTQLKVVTGHIGVVRKQGSIVPIANTDTGGKVIALRKIFRGKTAEDIWTSIILSLPPAEVNKLVPRDEGIVIANQTSATPTNEMLNYGGGSRAGIYVSSVEEAILEPQNQTIGGDIVKLINSPSYEEPETLGEHKLEKMRPGHNIKIEITPANEEPTKKANELLRKTKEVGGKKADDKDDELDELPEATNLKSAEMETRTSVRDLANVFNENAEKSSTSLTDHIKILQGNKDKNRRPQRKNNRDSYAPLGPSGHSWLMAASRCDYHTLLRLARQEEALVDVRDPAAGYTALHWAGKHGNDDIIKLLVGTYGQDPNVRSRGGYTPLMLAGLFKRHSSYNLLLEAYKADEMLRDFSGRTAYQYLELHHMEIPGIPTAVEMSHDQSKWQRQSGDNIDGPRMNTVKVARSKTHYFMKEGIRGLRDSMRISSSRIKEELRPRSSSLGLHEDVLQ